MKHYFFFAMAFVISMVNMGCQYDPDSNTYVTDPPPERDIVGTYNFARQRVNDSVTIPGHPVITLFANHSCQITDFPDWSGGGLVPWKLSGTHSSTGTWAVDTVASLDNGGAKTKPVYGIRFQDPRATFYASLTLSNNMLGLHFGYGDPDGGNSMIFQKIK